MVTAIVLAGGRSTRMGGGPNKQFIELLGKPLLYYSLAAFEQCPLIDTIVLVRRSECAEQAAQIARQFKKVAAFADSGIERQNSVWNGLEALSPASEIVAIQDAARPCTNGELIAATVRAADESGAAVAAQPVTDTVKESADGRFIQRTLDRSRLWTVQTPQTFRVEVIRRALAEARRRKLIFTDDTSACELIGQPVRLVSSVAPNPKVTVPGDLPFIETLLKGKI